MRPPRVISTLKFAEWATEGTDRSRVDTFAVLLRSQMRLPAEEIPASPIPQPPSYSIAPINREHTRPHLAVPIGFLKPYKEHDIAE